MTTPNQPAAPQWRNVFQLCRYLCRVAISRIIRFLLFRWPIKSSKPLRQRALNVLKSANQAALMYEKDHCCTVVNTLPSEIIIETTKKCNLFCKMCFRQFLDEDLNRQPDIDRDTLERVIHDYFPTALYVNISLTGEPLMSRHLDYISRQCNKFGIKMSLVTNGVLLDRLLDREEMIRALGRVEVSIDSKDAALHADMRDNSSLSDIMLHLQQLVRQRATDHLTFSIGISVTLTDMNVMELPDLVRWVHDWGGDYLRARFAVYFDARMKTKESALRDKYRDIYDDFTRIAKDLGIDLTVPPKPFPPSVKPKFIAGDARYRSNCRYLYQTVHIDRRGCLVPCLFYRPPLLADAVHACGGGWMGKEMLALREEHASGSLREECSLCELR